MVKHTVILLTKAAGISNLTGKRLKSVKQSAAVSDHLLVRKQIQTSY